MTTTWPAARMSCGSGSGVSPSYDAGGDVYFRGFRQLAKRGELVLAERLGGEQVERSGGRVFGDRLQHGQVEAERLARRRRRDDHDVVATPERVERLCLVGVQHLDALAVERTDQSLIEPPGKGAVCAGRSGRTR